MARDRGVFQGEAILIALLALSCLLAQTSGFVVLTIGSCPKVSTKQNFDLSQYQGPWYSYENFDVPYQYFNNDCVRAVYRPTDRDGQVSVLNTGNSRIKDPITGKYTIVDNARAEGTATVVDYSVPGALRVEFDSIPDGIDIGDGANYLILATDYNTYSLVYSCVEYWFLKTEAAWILVREPNKRPAVTDILKHNMKVWGIDPSYFKRINQEDCIYPEE